MRKLLAVPCLTAVLVASSAAAQDPLVVDDGTAVAAEGAAYVERGITLPARTLRVDLGPYEQGINNSGVINGPQGSAYGLRFGQQRVNADEVFADAIATMGFGVSYGITDWLEVGGNLLPIAMDAPFGFYTDDAEEAGFGNITVYGRASFVNTELVQLGAQLALSFPTGVDAFGLAVGVPVNFNLGSVRLETGLELETYFIDGPGEYVGLDIPLGVTFGLGDFFVGGHTALTIANLSEDNTFLIIPLGAHGGYSFRGGVLDADVTATFSYHIFTDEDGVDDTRYAEWIIGLGGTMFFPL